MSLSKFKMNRYDYEIKDLNTVRLNSLQVQKKRFLPVVHKSLTSYWLHTYTQRYNIV